MKVRAGAALRDVTPPAGLMMSGFAARTGPALGAHDPLTVRALAVDDTAILVADVIGVEAAMSARIRERCTLPAANIVIAAVHNHGGPGSMRSRVRVPPDETWLTAFEDACVAALDEAAARQRPAVMHFSAATDPGLARNRRQPDGPVDRVLPCLKLRGEDGEWIAVLASWACHPVVLGADNRLWTADYAHFLRTALETAHPGAIALAATGCCGDVNTGHSAQASITLAASDARTFARAAELGGAIAARIIAATSEPVASTGVRAAEEHCTLPLRAAAPAALASDLAGWRAALPDAAAAERALLKIWIGWAETTARRAPQPLPARVSALRWGDVALLAMPGEIFAETAMNLRKIVGLRAFVLSYAEDNPGYICPTTAFAAGGYEVDQAHRYYDMPTGFAPGCAETLEDGVRAAWARLSDH